jgi:hypothetical protein
MSMIPGVQETPATLGVGNRHFHHDGAAVSGAKHVDPAVQWVTVS